MIHSLRDICDKLRAPCDENTFEERFISHLIAVCVYPTLADVVGMKMVNCRSFSLDVQVYVEFVGGIEIGRNLCRRYAWLLNSTHTNTYTEEHRVKIYTLLFGRLDDFNVLDIQADGYEDLFAYNEWGISKDAVSSIINI
jgi:hypothetical protein